MTVAKVLIIDEQEQYLLMIRDNHPKFGNDPDLPGGTIEDGESAIVAAVREVEEEAGISINENDLELLYEGSDYSAHKKTYSLYVTRVATRPKVTTSWEHISYEWLSREAFLKATKDSVDTYMKMVYEVVSKLPVKWESGRESELLDSIIGGTKTIEGRLNKGKFAEYKVGDTVSLRRDMRSVNGELQDGEPNAATVELVAIRKYPDFLSMVTAEGYKKVIPNAKNAEEAADEYNKYYSQEDQRTYGVLAIEIRFLY